MKIKLQGLWGQGPVQFKLLILMIFISFNSTSQSLSEFGPIEEWRKVYTASSSDRIASAVKTPDGGYLLGGYSNSPISGDKTTINKGRSDYWIIKVDKQGNKQWDKSFGGEEHDDLIQILPTADGYLLCGNTGSPKSGDISEAAIGMRDIWIVKISTIGDKIWDKRYGGSEDDQFAQAVVTTDGGIILAGTAAISKNGQIDPGDYWIVKITSQGSVVWTKNHGGSPTPPSPSSEYSTGHDYLLTILKRPEGGYLLVGSSQSAKGPQKSVSSDGSDYWFVKINDLGSIEWEHTIVLENGNVPTSIIPSNDGGYIISGLHTFKEDHPDYGLQYYTDLELLKVNNTGNLLSKERFAEYHGYPAQLVPAINGFYLWTDFFGDLLKFNNEGGIDYRKPLPGRVHFLNNFSTELIMGINGGNMENEDFGIIKLKQEPSDPTPCFVVNFGLPYPNETALSISTFYIPGGVSKVEYLSNGSKFSESNGATYTTWKNIPMGNNSLTVKVYASSGAVFSRTIPYFEAGNLFGNQAERGLFQIVADPGNNKIVKEDYNTLNAGSSMRLWDVGDKVRYWFRSREKGMYKIKIYLRSGGYSSSWDSPKAYWPNGYSFWMNGQSVKFVGNDNSISAKNPAYGGSYWGFMVSPEVFIDGNTSLDIQANMAWAGIDYIELIPVKAKLEAELVYSGLVDVGTNPLGVENHQELSDYSSAKLWDIGDKIRLSLPSMGGSYRLKARIRASKQNAFFTNGYSFWVNNVATTFTGDISSISPFNASYGGSYWGDMVADVTLKEGVNHLDIQANLKWLGVDYITIEPTPTSSARIATVENSTFLAYPNPIQDQLNIEFPEGVDGEVNFVLFDSYGKVYLNKKQKVNNSNNTTLSLPVTKLKPGIYSLKISANGFNKVVQLSKE